jgi:hypothetical protein
MATTSDVRFTISLADGLLPTPVTGRMFLAITRSIDRPYVVASGPGEVGGSERGLEPRLQAGAWKNRVPFFGTYQQAVPYFSPWVGSVPFFAVDVDQLAAGERAVIDASVLGFPPKSLLDIPAGDYYVQAVLNVYTEFRRSDGRVIWAHMDQWEGQHWNHSAGNPISTVYRVHLDPAEGYDIHIDLTALIPEPQIPDDTEWVRRIKLKSELLSEFWGHPIYLGATALLPKGYDEHPERRYPVLYAETHFGLGAPFGFTTTGGPEGDEQRYMRTLRGLESGYEFYQAWNSDDFPRMIVVQTQHPTPYFDSSYAVDSENNGPYGQAYMTELIPRVEEAFRIIREPRARSLTGGSTGGWVSLALQVKHPEFFGGTWSFAPDCADLRRYGLTNIYVDDNAFTAPNREWLVPERVYYRSPDGQPEITTRQISQFEAVLGSHGRSTEQLDIWQAAFGPVGDDGYPRPLWDKMTGVIDHDVANYMRDHGYDLRHYVEENWAEIGRNLVGKLHVFCADMDDYFLNLGVYPLEDFLENTTDPYYAGSFTYGRPVDGHVWHPMNHAELIRTIDRHMKWRTGSPHHFSSMPARAAAELTAS